MKLTNEMLGAWDKNPIGKRPAPDGSGSVWVSAHEVLKKRQKPVREQTDVRLP